MAEEHNAIKYGPQISKAGAIAAGGAYSDVGISRLSETLTPIIDLWSRPEWELLRGEILFARSLDVPAVAARFGTCEIVNPAASTKLVVIRLIDIPQSSDSVDMVIDTGGAIAANPVTSRGVAIDGRFPQLGETSICTIVTGDTAAGVGPLRQWRHRNGLQQLDVPKWVLSPGTKLFLLTGAVLQSFSVNILFSERSPFPGELQARG